MTNIATPPRASFDPRSRDYLTDPQAALQDALEESSVWYHEQLNTYYVLRYDDVRSVVTDSETFSSHSYKGVPVREELRARIPLEWENAGQLIQGLQVHNLDAPEHTVQRRALQRTFTHKQIRRVQPDIEAIANELIDGFIANRSCDIMRDFASTLTLRVVGTLMGVPKELLTDLQSWMIDVLGVLAPIHLKPEDVTTPDDELVGIFERVHNAYVRYTEFMEDKRANPGDDLCSAMLTLTDEDGRPALSTDEVLAHMVGITAAGTDTTANLIVSMVRLFTERPDELELVLDDPTLWDNAVQEGLRRAGVAAQIGRICTTETVVGEVTIPGGATMALSLPAANSDPRQFPDPLCFDVRRTNASEHLGLGRGRHYCLGSTLAPPETRIALETLYRRLPDLRADLDQELQVVPALAVRGIVSQRAIWTAV
jgi:cytochrome P450